MIDKVSLAVHATKSIDQTVFELTINAIEACMRTACKGDGTGMLSILRGRNAFISALGYYYGSMHAHSSSTGENMKVFDGLHQQGVDRGRAQALKAIRDMAIQRSMCKRAEDVKEEDRA